MCDPDPARSRSAAGRSRRARDRRVARARNVARDALAVHATRIPLGLRLQLRDACPEQHRLHRLLQALGEDVDQIAIDTRPAARPSSRRRSRRCQAPRRPTRARGRCSRRPQRAATRDVRRNREQTWSPSRAESPLPGNLRAAGTTGTEPVARIACSNWMVSSPPAVSFTRSVCASTSSPSPWTSCTFRLFTRSPVPLVSRLTTASLNARRSGRSDRGLSRTRRPRHPHGGLRRIRLATCSSAFDGMQPR